MGPLQQLRALKTPERIQRYLDERIGYNKDHTLRSPVRVVEHGKAQCLEGALFGAAALSLNGYPALLLDMEAVRDDDHVVALFRSHNCWGSIAKSNFAGLRFREPVYRTLRELAISYFEHYYNLRGEKTLRTYSRPVNLKRFDRMHWITAEEDLWPISDYLFSVRHWPLVGPDRKLNRVDRRLYHSGMFGME